METTPSIQTSKIGQIFKKNGFSTQNERYTAKLCFSVVLNHIWGKFTEILSFLSKKWLSQIEALVYSKS